MSAGARGRLTAEAAAAEIILREQGGGLSSSRVPDRRTRLMRPRPACLVAENHPRKGGMYRYYYIPPLSGCFCGLASLMDFR